MTALPRPARGSGGASGSQTPLLTCVVTQTPRPPLGDRGLAAAPVSPRVCLTLLRRAQGPTPCGPSCVTTAGGCSGRGHGRVTQSRSSSRGRAPRGPVLPAGTPCSLALASQPRPWRPWDSGACGGVLTCLSPSPGHANASFCPHGYGCRTLVVCEGQTVLDVTDGELTVTVRVPEGRWLWLVSPETGVPVWGRPAPHPQSPTERVLSLLWPSPVPGPGAAASGVPQAHHTRLLKGTRSQDVAHQLLGPCWSEWPSWRRRGPEGWREALAEREGPRGAGHPLMLPRFHWVAGAAFPLGPRRCTCWGPDQAVMLPCHLSCPAGP